MILLMCGCSSSGTIQPGIFFPTWEPGNARPAAIVQGDLVERDRCVYLRSNEELTLIAWEVGMGYDHGALLARDGESLARVGETVHGGGGYFGRAHIEELSGSTVPERCALSGPDQYAIIYEVEPGPFA